MLKIAVCDDEEYFRNLMLRFLQQYSEQFDVEIDASFFSSGEELLKAHTSDTELIFLDIQMGGQDGIETARQLRRIDPKVCIIFITNMLNRAIDGYSVHAWGFVSKPLTYPELSHQLSSAIRQIKQSREKVRTYTVRTTLGTENIPVQDILYVEVERHSIHLHTKDRTISFRGSMKDLEEDLTPMGFLRPHASFLVNVRHVKKVEQNELVLTDNDTIPVSQKRRRDFLSDMSSVLSQMM